MFGVYRNAYWARLAEALGNDFPGLKALVGDLTMRLELSREKIRRMEAGDPLASRKSRR